MKLVRYVFVRLGRWPAVQWCTIAKRAFRVHQSAVDIASDSWRRSQSHADAVGPVYRPRRRLCSDGGCTCSLQWRASLQRDMWRQWTMFPDRSRCWRPSGSAS